MIPNPSPGAFFAVEGIDGAGKSTQLELLLTWLKGLGLKAEKTKEPDKEGVYGKLIYKDLADPNGLHRTNPIDFQRWYACDSRANVRDNVIQFITNPRGVVVSDRFRPSMVYGADRKDDISKLMAINEAIIGEYFIWPDAIFVLDVSIELALLRLKGKGRELDGHENRKKLSVTRERYMSFAETYRNCHVINADADADSIFQRVKKIAEDVLRKKGQIQ